MFALLLLLLATLLKFTPSAHPMHMLPHAAQAAELLVTAWRLRLRLASLQQARLGTPRAATTSAAFGVEAPPPLPSAALPPPPPPPPPSALKGAPAAIMALARRVVQERTEATTAVTEEGGAARLGKPIAPIIMLPSYTRLRPRYTPNAPLPPYPLTPSSPPPLLTGELIAAMVLSPLARHGARGGARYTVSRVKLSELASHFGVAGGGSGNGGERRMSVMVNSSW